jgi:hypothetical protein
MSLVDFRPEIRYILQRCCVMESCDFVNEEFPAEIQKFAKEQQVLVYAKYSNFLYTVLANVILNSDIL